MIQLQANNRLLFIGDSITDAGRRYYFGANLGQGYVTMLAGHLHRHYTMLKLQIINRGIGGNIVTDLKERWQEDCLALQPDILSIQIGINDIWHRHSAGLTYTDAALEQFKENYHYLITSAQKQNPQIQITLIEPFVLPEPADRLEWRPHLEKQISIIESLANECQTHLIRLDEPLNEAGKNLGYKLLTGEDGVHPTNLGHALIANQWLRQTGL